VKRPGDFYRHALDKNLMHSYIRMTQKDTVRTAKPCE